MKPPQGPTSALGYLLDIILICASQYQNSQIFYLKKKKALVINALSVIF